MLLCVRYTVNRWVRLLCDPNLHRLGLLEEVTIAFQLFHTDPIYDTGFDDPFTDCKLDWVKCVNKDHCLARYSSSHQYDSWNHLAEIVDINA